MYQCVDVGIVRTIGCKHTVGGSGCGVVDPQVPDVCVYVCMYNMCSTAHTHTHTRMHTHAHTRTLMSVSQSPLYGVPLLLGACGTQA